MKTSWTSPLSPQYFTQGNIRYERNFIDVEEIEEGYKRVPIDFDTTEYAVLYDDTNIVVRSNPECSSGCFFVPFIRCDSKEILMQRIGKLVVRLGNAITARTQDNNPTLKVFVYRYIDGDGNRHFAIGGTNLNPKCEEIHCLNVKTMLSKTVEPSLYLSWFATIEEMSDVNETPTCVIRKEEVLDFESRVIQVRECCSNVLTMLPKSSSFFAQHLCGVGVSSFYSKEWQETCNIFGLSTQRVLDTNEFNLLIKRMIESYRELTGNVYVETVALYTNLENAIDISIASFTKVPAALDREKDDEEYPSF